MQPASLRGLFLIDLLLFANATDRAAKTDVDIEGRRVVRVVWLCELADEEGQWLAIKVSELLKLHDVHTALA